MPSTPRSLVLGFSARLPARDVAPFARSLRSTGFRGRLGLITAHYDPDTRRELATLADVVVDVDVDALFQPASAAVSALQWLRRTRGLRRLYPGAFAMLTSLVSERRAQARRESYEFHLEGLQSLRYALYHDFIVKHTPDVDFVLISDLRDVIFQGDPFDAPVTGLECYLEEDTSRIGSSPFNRRWIADLYGTDRVRQLAEEVVSCSGTTVGTRDAMLDYLARMAEAITWRRQPLGSHDQGVHNHLLRSNSFGDVQIVRNGYGRVLTMGEMTSFAVDEDGRVCNRDGTIPPVLHQFDRHPPLAARLWEAYRCP